MSRSDRLAKKDHEKLFLRRNVTRLLTVSNVYESKHIIALLILNKKPYGGKYVGILNGHDMSSFTIGVFWS